MIKRAIIAFVAATGLLFVFLFQHVNVALLLGLTNDPLTQFIINKSIRFFLNDLLAILLVYALFFEKKYVIVAIAVQVIGIFLLLIPYFILKINFPAYNGPLINFLHRLIMNPVLIFLLIPAFYLQKRKQH